MRNTILSFICMAMLMLIISSTILLARLTVNYQYAHLQLVQYNTIPEQIAFLAMTLALSVILLILSFKKLIS